MWMSLRKSAKALFSLFFCRRKRESSAANEKNRFAWMDSTEKATRKDRLLSMPPLRRESTVCEFCPVNAMVNGKRRVSASTECRTHFLRLSFRMAPNGSLVAAFHSRSLSISFGSFVGRLS